MADTLSFDRQFSATPGVPEPVAPGVRRILAPNPGPFTFTGTCTYLLGEGEVAIIDPGPDDEAHVAAVLRALGGERVSHIVLTHTHRDHCGAVAALKRATGARLFFEGPHRPARPPRDGEAARLDAAGDAVLRPDVALADGDIVSGKGWTLSVLATPGHTANHLAFAYAEGELIFAGDHVMAWSTTVVAPPDGAMRDYMSSLRKLAARPEDLYLPGHGGPVRDAHAVVARYLRHRKAREDAILRALGRGGAATIGDLVRAVYIGLDPRLAGAAALSTLAHLEDLVARGVVRCDGEPRLDGLYERL